jgi:hypothetical protein
LQRYKKKLKMKNKRLKINNLAIFKACFIMSKICKKERLEEDWRKIIGSL